MKLAAFKSPFPRRFQIEVPSSLECLLMCGWGGRLLSLEERMPVSFINYKVTSADGLKLISSTAS